MKESIVLGLFTFVIWIASGVVFSYYHDCNPDNLQPAKVELQKRESMQVGKTYALQQPMLVFSEEPSEKFDVSDAFIGDLLKALPPDAHSLIVTGNNQISYKIGDSNAPITLTGTDKNTLEVSF